MILTFKSIKQAAAGEIDGIFLQCRIGCGIGRNRDFSSDRRSSPASMRCFLAGLCL
jgi:hypothetical protein